MYKLLFLLEKAKDSKFYLWLLNRVLWVAIPFNRPHRLKIVRLTETDVEIKMPYRRSNWNHLKGLHACGLATVSEYATGLLLLQWLTKSKCRLIMESLKMEYHYQGKMDGIAKFSLDKKWIEENILNPLKTNDVVYIEPKIQVHDTDGNLLTTGEFRWQIKQWDKVKTKV